MQFIKPGINIDFIGKRKIAFVFSLIIIAISIGTLVVHKGPRYGIDFAGGTLVQVKFEGPIAIDQIKSGLKTMDMDASSVQQFGMEEDNEYLIRTDATTSAMDDLSEKIEKNLKEATGTHRRDQAC
jgi:preprotein translocase subunit SecF